MRTASANNIRPVLPATTIRPALFVFEFCEGFSDDEVLCKRYKFVPKSLLESQVEKDVPRGRSSARRGHCRGGFCRGGLGDIEVLGLTEDAVQIFWNNPDSVVTPGWEYGVI
jgi:hypothetical protein